MRKARIIARNGHYFTIGDIVDVNIKSAYGDCYTVYPIETKLKYSRSYWQYVHKPDFIFIPIINELTKVI